MAQRWFIKENSLYGPPSGGSPGEKSRNNTLRVSELPQCEQKLNQENKNKNGVLVAPFLFSANPSQKRFGYDKESLCAES